MKIFGSTPHPEVVHNAAPIQPAQPAFQALPKRETDALKGLRLSGTQDQDIFVRSQPVEVESFIPPGRALWQITTMTPASLRAHIAQKMASGNSEDLYHVASWLSVAQQHGKIQYAKRDDAELNFGKHLRESMDALQAKDFPLSTISLQRARRQIQDLQNLKSISAEPTLPPKNPFVLHY